MALTKYQKAAQEMNEVMGLDPEIDIHGDEESLIEEIKENMKEIEPRDVFSEETQTILDEMSGKGEQVTKKKEPAAKKKPAAKKAKEDVAEKKNPAKKKPAAKKAKEDVAEKKNPATKKAPKSNERREYIAGLISKGKLTRQAIIEKAMDQFPEATKSAIVTLVTDGKNPKYNKFEKLVVEDPETKVLSFE